MARPTPPPPAPAPARTEAHRTTRPEDRVPAAERIGFGCGKVVVDGSLGTINVLVSPIYNMTLGLNPALISTVVFLQRISDAMLDPICGQFSDNFRSRWGRRIPLMVVSLPLLAFLFAAIWWVPRGASENHLFLHLLIVSLVFFVAHSIYAMAIGGLMIEATDDYHERTRITAITLSFGCAFIVGSQWLFPLTQLAIFGDTTTGLRWVATGCGVAFLLVGFLPVFLCRERHYARAAHLPPSSFRASFEAVRNNRPFRVLLGARFIASFGYNLVGILFMYMNNYSVFGGDLKKASVPLGVLGSAFQVAAIVSALFIYPPLVQRFGKKRVFQIAACVLMIGCASKLFVYLPDHPWPQFIVLITNGTSNAGMMVTVGAMLGDIADFDELRTGLRREALFMSMANWCDKAGNSLGSLVTGFILVWIGFDAKSGVQSGHTLALMKYCYALAPFAGAVIALLIMQRYDLDEKRVYAIRDELARRRQPGTPAGSPVA